MIKSSNNPTISDIAKKAGVSLTTVSRVLSNSNRVKPKTKEKVQKVIDELGYIPNYFAQCLAGHQSKKIGVIVDEIGNFFFTELLASIQSYLNEQGYSIQIAYSKWDADKELDAVKNFISNNVDGIIIAPVSSSSGSIELLKNRNFPFVVINCILDDKTTCIANNNYKGGKIVAEFFNKKKAQQSFIISGWNDQSLLLRIEGFKDNIESSDKLFSFSNVLSDEQIREVCETLVNEYHVGEISSNIFITNDILAIPLTNYLIEKGINIPDSVSIISYDNIYFSRYCRIPLSTIDHGINEVGTKASAELIKKIKGEKSVEGNILVEPKLVIREST
ncbi:MAG: LacI family DNA-binding transcriptional regulator [Peptostreptococcaceae bacterium]|nr:LacI family DNA-binding transcriptional regulator [Peptostreptococcaceae bacterium]